MKKIYLLAFAFFYSLNLIAQSPSIVITYPETACLNTAQKIQVAISGTFNTDNKFSVQVRKSENSPVISELPARLISGKIEVIHTDSSLSLLPYIQLRVAATSPKAESNWYNVLINTKGSVNLSVANSDTINAGEALTLKFTTFSSSTANIVLNDGSGFSVSSFERGYFNTYHQKGINVSTPFYIQKAENICGPMSVSGQVKATINTVSLKTISVSPAATCEGNEIKVGFSASGPALPAGTRYKLRISVYQGDLLNVKSVEVPARLIENILVANFPKTFNLSGRSKYKVRVLTENPALAGLDTDFDFVVYPAASANITTPSKTINIGEQITIGVGFSGLAPYSAILQNETVATTNSYGDIQVRPEKSTSYKVSGLTTGCGVTPEPSGPTMVVTVRPGIAMEPLTGSKSFCAGSTARIRMLSNVEFNTGTTFSVNAVINNKTAYSFPAQKSGEYLEFQIPVLAENTDRSLSYDKISAFFISTTSPAYQSAYSSGYLIKSKPDMLVLPHSVTIHKEPSQALFGYELLGQGPFSIEDAAGTVNQIEGYTAWYPDLYINKTQDFKLKSISNSCFKNEKLPTVSLTLDTAGAAPGIHMQPLKTLVCRQDSIEITFIKTGSFKAGNAFRIEGYSDCCEFQLLASVNKDGTFKVKVPVSQQSAFSRFRVTSTNPVLSSRDYQIQMQTPPAEFRISPSATRESPAQYLAEQDVILSLSTRDGGLSSFVYTDGVTEQTFLSSPGGYEARITPPKGQVTAYTIKTATNQCGTFPVNQTTYIQVLPYRISIQGGEEGKNLSACQNGNLTVPFVTLNGDASNGKFSLQIAKDKNTAFSDIASNITSRVISTSIPANTAPGLYQMRIVSSEGSISNIVNLFIGSPPTATLTATATGPITINPGQGVPSSISFTGSPSWTIIYENSEKQITDNNPYTRNLTTDRGKEFSLISVYNSCGYGAVSGKIAVKVNPTLHAFAEQEEVCVGATVPVRYLLQGDASLDNDFIVFQLVDTQNNQTIRLDSTKNREGTIILKIPANLSGNFYELRSILKSYAITSSVKLTVKKKTDVSIIGNTTINPGENAQLQLRSNLPFNEAIQYKLSDGQTGTFYGGTGNSEFFVKVSPSTTTVYTIISADNGCGEGKKSGSATVEVNPVSERTVTVTSWDPFERSAFCVAEAILVNYTSKGTFSATNTMTVQLSDTTGRNFKSIVTTGTSSPLKATVPADLVPGKKYRIRVIASDPGTGSGAYEYPLSPGTRATARFSSASLLEDPSGISKLAVLLSGTGPWEYDFGSSLDITTRHSVSPIDTIYLSQKPLSEYYKIFRVSNRCGTGTIETPDIVRAQVVLGENPHAIQVVIGPNPAEDQVVVKFPDNALKTIIMLNSAGIEVLKKSTSLKEDFLNIRQFPAGIYLLHIEGKNTRSTFKILKH
ncbi:T9SS type A sorting domain-containing protein [Dyadobacter diqingensis]|uniref:T9SS type A sorting domain-containing protein n=1 Tax=Dyadobacter diqingensis TaxID=2938121 RepID=UPI0020C1B69D|nr:T9SS type A sorting domain-containing protein [Dyadobacter diqingensis]